MTLTQIKYFLKIAETKNFSKASEELFVSQPTLSRSIASLEDELCLSLFVRSKPIILTDAGIVFYEKAKEIEKKLLELETTMATYATEYSGHRSLRISYHHFDSVVAPILLNAMRRFSETRPHDSLIIRDFVSTEVSLLSPYPDCDVIFTLFCDAQKYRDQINYREICKDPVLAIVPITHPLAKREALLMQDFVDEPVLMVGTNLLTPNKDLIYIAFQDSGYALRNVKQIPNPNLLIPTVLTENRVALIPASIAEQYQFRIKTELRVLPITDCNANTDVIVAWRKDDTNPAIPVFVEELFL